MIIDLWKNPHKAEIVKWVMTLDRSAIIVRTNNYEIELLKEEDAVVFNLKFAKPTPGFFINMSPGAYYTPYIPDIPKI